MTLFSASDLLLAIGLTILVISLAQAAPPPAQGDTVWVTGPANRLAPPARVPADLPRPG